ncbi:SpaH/EbpB family LPXTG-anchored major pilin [Lacticaseibacillus mingshuiensis]|uniref:SpaH/EbpB family LPXTG-anchored major pilin n=1 Tax=Lacticaseibacillus mingshuiensis TaxID=2799574 RepID=A0ABW4CGL6_9LACO|nr:SpaH/EbpB family LPXTG-anchored major pilin [Lacticaseibacillus mingshuiensis]
MKKSVRLLYTIGVCGLALGALTTTAVTLVNNGQSTIAAGSSLVSDDTSTRSITIHKYSGTTPTTAATGTTADADSIDTTVHKPLSGIKFTVQKVTPVNGAKNMSAADATTYTTDGDATTTAATDDDGTTVADLGTGTSADGYYLVTEVASAAVATPTDPFIVHVPLTIAGVSGGDATLAYDVNVYPKNDTENITLNPNKTFPDSSKAESVKVGSDVSWNLQVDTPKDIYTAGSEEDDSDAIYAKDLTISDPINSKTLAFKSVDSVKAIAEDGTATDLVETDDDYTVSHSSDVTGYDVVMISLTKSGMKKAAGSKNIVVQLTTTIQDVTSDASIVNTFDSFYTPSTGGTPTHESTTPGDPTNPSDPGNPTDPKDPNKPDTPDPDDPGDNPEVVYGNVDILKTDDTSDATPLANATFKLAASEQDAKDGKWITDNDGNVISGTTKADGTLEFTGLLVDPTTKTQKYYLVETDAPAGYNVDGTVHEVTAQADTTLDATIKDSDNLLPNLPMTGSDARLLILVTASVLIVGSGSMIYIKRRKDEKNA